MRYPTSPMVSSVSLTRPAPLISPVIKTSLGPSSENSALHLPVKGALLYPPESYLVPSPVPGQLGGLGEVSIVVPQNATHPLAPRNPGKRNQKNIPVPFTLGAENSTLLMPVYKDKTHRTTSPVPTHCPYPGGLPAYTSQIRIPAGYATNMQPSYPFTGN